MKRLLLCLLLTGCASEEHEPENVRVVVVQCDKRSEDPDDCVTVVEFPDGWRAQRTGNWGEVGDTFRATRHTSYSTFR